MQQNKFYCTESFQNGSVHQWDCITIPVHLHFLRHSSLHLRHQMKSPSRDNHSCHRTSGYDKCHHFYDIMILWHLKCHHFHHRHRHHSFNCTSGKWFAYICIIFNNIMTINQYSNNTVLLSSRSSNWLSSSKWSHWSPCQWRDGWLRLCTKSVLPWIQFNDMARHHHYHH